MGKVKGPLFSLGASGQIGKALVYFPWKGVNAVREYVIPANPKSAAQIVQRNYLHAVVDNWHQFSFTDADRIAWNRYAGILPKAMSGFNAFVRLCIGYRLASISYAKIADVQVDTPTVVGFDVDVENSSAGLTLKAYIGTSKTHFPTQVALVDDTDDTYSLTWAGGASKIDYYVKIMQQLGGVWYQVSGIYHVKSA